MERCGWVSQDPLYIAYHEMSGACLKLTVKNCSK